MTNNSSLSSPRYILSSHIVAHIAEVASTMTNILFHIQSWKIYPLKTGISTSIVLGVSLCKESSSDLIFSTTADNIYLGAG